MEMIYAALWKVWQITNHLVMMDQIESFAKYLGMKLLIYFTNL